MDPPTNHPKAKNPMCIESVYNFSGKALHKMA